MEDPPRVEAEGDPETEYEKTRRAAFLQLFRVGAVLGAILGKTLPAIFGLLVAVFADIVIQGSFTMSISGEQVPILFIAKALSTTEILRGVAVVALASDPALRKVDP